MTLEVWSTIASIGTFVVIGTTAIAALVQLRHMRSSNQIAILTTVYETLESEHFAAARRFLATELPRMLESDAGLALLAGPPPLPPETAPIREVANFFENVGAFVKNGMIDKRIACDLWAGVVLLAWKAAEPVVLIRRARGPDQTALWENFEYLAVLSEQFIQSHPDGTYPKGLRHMQYAQRALDLAAAARRFIET
jgi:Domain of unknown function (DUF4760)